MYVGRIVAIGKSHTDRLLVMYRVSSRSFPNRQARLVGTTISVIPKEGFEADGNNNPYIAYNCLRLIGSYAVVSNGTHTDPIAEKVKSGMRMRDAVISTLSGLDYEHDELGTPRITAIVDRETRLGVLGIVRTDALIVREFDLEMGEVLYLATYEQNYPDNEFRDVNVDVTSAEEACDYILGKGVFTSLERPILAACAIENASGYSIACKEMKQT
jgi:IMP cyclohydrolase